MTQPADDLPDDALSGLFQDAMTVAESESLHDQLVATEDRYEIFGEFGSGGRKQVYQARDRLTGREVALAVLRPPADDEGVERFLREARMLAQLQHPSIVPVYDVGVSDEYGPYFVMKPAEVATVEDVVKGFWRKDSPQRNTWTLAARLDLFARICDGMSYAHSHGILHLDLKPSNVLLGAYGEVLISDWGIARRIDEMDFDQDLHDDEAVAYSRVRIITQHGLVKGTPGYMAPEQMLAEEVTVATDVYGLGGILYALLTSFPPVSGPDFETIEHRTIHGVIQRPIHCRPDLKIPKGLDAIAMKALAKDPQRRYRSVSELRRDMDQFRAGYTPAAHDAGSWHRLKLTYRRNQTAANLIGAAVALVAGLTFTFVRHLEKERRSAVIARAAAFDSLEEIVQQQLPDKDILAPLSADQTIRIQQGWQLANQLVIDAGATLKAGESAKAMTLLHAAVGIAPQHPRARQMRGDLYAASMDVERALKDYAFLDEPMGSSLMLVVQAYAQKPIITFEDRRRAYRTIWLAIRHQERPELLRASVDLSPFDALPLYEQMEIRFELLRILNPKQQEWFPTLEIRDGMASVSFRNHQNLHNLEALRNAPIRALDLSRTAVDQAQLAVLESMKLEQFSYEFGAAKSVDVVATENLKEVNLAHSAVRSIDRLALSPLESLDVAFTPVDDFKMLRDCLSLRLLKIDRNQYQAARIFGSRVRIQEVTE